MGRAAPMMTWMMPPVTRQSPTRGLSQVLVGGCDLRFTTGSSVSQNCFRLIAFQLAELVKRITSLIGMPLRCQTLVSNYLSRVSIIIRFAKLSIGSDDSLE